MGHQHVKHYSSSDSEPEAPSTPPPRQRRQRRSTKGSLIPYSQSVSSSSPSSSTTTTDDKKKKERKKKDLQKPPQERINSIWERFSQKKFSKALAVLPFAPVQASSAGDRGNELLEVGYERAAEECRRKVRKIISECRRINTRYRDPSFDLDWDFKLERGQTLNSLDKTMFELSQSTLKDPKSNVPKAVKRVHEIFEKPTFMENVLPSDMKQGSLGDCWLVASLTGLANVPDGVKRMCVEYDTKIGIYGFVFYRDGEWIYSIIDDKLFLKSPCWDSPSMQRSLLQQIEPEDVERVYRETYQTGSQALFFAQNKDQNETWVPLVEKAYAKAHGDFASLDGGWIGEALEDLSGGVTTELLASDIFDVDAFWTNELLKVNKEFMFGCSTGLLDGGYGARDGIAEGHAYVIMDARELKDGKRLCKLRNPWGKVRKGNWEGAWSDGSKEWTTEAQKELNHTFGSDSTFWIPYEDLLRKYLHFDRTRLFRDPGWRSCQRWIGVEVPWKAQYNEKFHLKLTKESPVVLVLSQLDNRYFRGLQGQYRFRLQFRLHQEGRPSAEEYIVRSHGNYLMDRSVSVEVPALDPGNYSVYISISADRYSSWPSTEDVVRRECEDREENEKLAQVGQAYDLAHSKAAPHLESLSNLRKKAEGKKASEARRKKRRQTWERRQTTRAIKQKQEKKNEAKKAEVKQCKRAKAKAQAEAESLAKSEADAKAAAKKEAEKIKAESQPANMAIRTKSDKSKEGESQAGVDCENASTRSCSSSSTGTNEHTPQVSPEVQCSTTVKDGTAKIEVPPAQALANAFVSGGPPPQVRSTAPTQIGPLELKVHFCSCSTCKPPKSDEESDGYSSDSPVEDWEKLYADDDPKPAVRDAESPTSPTKEAESDDEDAPEPWNAIAVVGFRVYSKDENLELRVIMEGGELEQDGMGNLGEADLDNAVVNAAGQRDEINKKVPDIVVNSEIAAQAKHSDVQAPGLAAGDASNAANPSVQEGDGVKLAAMKAVYRTIIERKTSEFDRVMAKTKVDTSEDAAFVANNPSVKAPGKNSTSTQQPPVGQQPVCVQEIASASIQGASPAHVQTVPLNFKKPVENTKKAVLLIRSKLQSGCRNLLVQGQSPREKDIQEISDCLAQLESYSDLEADVILATKIHKVMMAILRLGHLPKDDGFKLGVASRAQALLDDYELSILTSDVATEIADGL